MKDSFIFEGKKYISSKRASEISDYASDYIGQLCRSGKVECKRIGRAWFICEESLNQHKENILRDDVARNRIENIRAGSRKNIAAKNIVSLHAREENETRNADNQIVSDHAPIARPLEPVVAATSTIDHTQNVETNVEATAVAKTEETIAENAPTADASVSAVPPLDWKIYFAPQEKITEILKGEVNGVVAQKEITSNVKKIGSTPDIFYADDSRPLLPILNKKSLSGHIPSPIAVSIPTSATRPVSNLATVLARTPIKLTVKGLDKVIEDRISEISTDTKTEIKLQSVINEKPARALQTRLVVEDHRVARISKPAKPIKVGKIISQPVVSYPELTRSIILKRVISSALVVMFVVGLGVASINMYVNSDSSTIAVNAPKISESVEANIIDAVDVAFSFVRNGVLAVFMKPSTITLNTSPLQGSRSIEIPELLPNGIAISPSSGSESADSALKEKIRDSFSDEVVINPDKSGTTGVITPVFRQTSGKDFVYVMVPVREKGTNATP